MRELRIIATTADVPRLRGVLTVAAAQAALGGKVSLFLQLEAVALLVPPITAPDDAAHVAAGLPSLVMLIEDAMQLDVALVACQSGMALYGLTADSLPTGVDVGGPVAFLQQTDDAARLLIV